MATRNDISRRDFIRLSTMVTAGVVASACAGAQQPEAVQQEAPQAAEQAPAAAKEEETKAQEAPAAAAEEKAGMPASQFNEAPMLAELVASGQLPPVDERLPANPAVIETLEGIGNYGGTIRRGFRGVSDRWGPTKMQNESLTWYNPDLSIRPNLAESWEINEDASQYTFHLREGMKWSDGHPLDSDSYKWWFENDLKNDTIRPSKARQWVTGPDNILMDMEFPDKATIVFKFAHPKPLFLFDTTRNPEPSHEFVPGHYMEQFHIDFVDDQDALKAAAKEAGFETWDQYYLDRHWWYLNPERPNAGPWIGKNPLSEELFVMERNPYFWQVDAEGNQLPYVDKVNHRLYESPDVFDLWITTGEIDYQGRGVNTANFTLYKENEDAGGYQVVVGPRSSHSALQLNLTTKNERLREFFNIREVRQALSVAVDRQQLVDIIWDGLTKPRQYSPISASPQYYEKQETAWIQHDPDLANQLLDEAGYAERDNDGFRLWKDGSGETLSFLIEGTALPGTAGEDEVQLIIKYFTDVGIKANYQGFERSLYTEHYESNNIEAGWWGGDRTVLPLADPIIFIGTQPDRPWSVAWALWRNTNGQDPNAEEPPEGHWIWDIWSLWDELAMEPDEARRDDLFRQILDIWAEELPMIGYVGEQPGLVIIKNGFKGYLPGYPLDNATEDEHLLSPQTYYWEEPDQHM